MAQGSNPKRWQPQTRTEEDLFEAFRTLGLSPYEAAVATAGRADVVSRAAYAIKLRCRKCGRVLDELEPFDSLREELSARPVRNARVTFYRNPETGQIWFARRPVASRLTSRPGSPTDTRWTFTCHRACGARYVIRQERLDRVFREARRDGRSEITAGYDV